LDYNPDVFKDKVILLPCDDPEWSNFTKFFASSFQDYGIKKIISTSYAGDGGRGKISIFDGVGGGEWSYLDGDGDFRSDEVTALRDEADIVVTNPPFSLLRDFMNWLIDGDVLFSIIGNMNAVAYKEIFPLIKDNEMWVGANSKGGSRRGNSLLFTVPGDVEVKNVVEYDGHQCTQVSAWWFTNIEHGRRHEQLELLSMADNLKYSRRKKIREEGYPEYDNYDAIEVGFTEAIPSDYKGEMGVPISCLAKDSPDQFEIVGMAKRGAGDPALKTQVYTKDYFSHYSDLNAGPTLWRGDVLRNTYPRVLIRHKI